MKKVGSMGMKVFKIIHLVLVCMWVGGGIALVAMVNAMISQKGGPYYGYLYAMKIVDDFIIIPGAMGTLLIGLLYGIFTGWGFFKHNWITVKWVLTVALILFGTFFLGPWLNGSVEITGALLDKPFEDMQVASNLFKLNLWGALQVAFLIFMVAISVLKPWRKKQ
ncbi:MAG: hypothetical protein WDA74_00275 [Spirochaetota bacterium]